MTGVRNFEQAGLADARAHECRKGAAAVSLAQNAIGALHQLLQRNPAMHQAAEHGVELRHQERCSDALPRGIAYQEKQLTAWTFDDVAVIAAHRANRLVVMRDLP